MRHLKTALQVVAITLSITSVAWTQGKELSKEEYYVPYRAALEKSRSFSRRITQNIRSNWGTKPVQEEWTYEYQLPGRRIRYVHEIKVDGKTTRSEEIDLEQAKYCKHGDGPWIISKLGCIGGSGSGGPSNIVSEVFRRVKTELNGERVSLYHQYITYKNVHSPTAATDGNSFWEEKYWVNDRGALSRVESRRGLVDSQTPKYEMVEAYTYDPKITIEAPIK
jgi:hypothetical protein